MNLSLYKLRKNSGLALLYTVLILFLIIFALPFLYVFILATHSQEEIFSFPPPFLPGSRAIENFKTVTTFLPFFRNYLNSILIAVLATAARLFFSTMSGFALAKYQFKGKAMVYTFILILLMVPQFFSIIPLFKMMVWLKWINTYFPLVVPGMADAFGVFIMAQYLSTSIPSELLDAGRIDGLGETKLLFHIGFPLAKPGLFVLGVITFIGSWNNFMMALIMLPSSKMHTLPVALSRLSVDIKSGYGALMMGNALAILPILILFIFFSKQILANFLAGSLKG